MSGEQDRDALAEFLYRKTDVNLPLDDPLDISCRDVAAALMPWLADHDRRERANALREAADEMYAIFMSGNLLGTASDLWLRERADRIEGVRARPGGCGVCATCDPPKGWASRMYVCATCGNKRCPAAGDCLAWECSGSNDPDQGPPRPKGDS